MVLTHLNPTAKLHYANAKKSLATSATFGLTDTRTCDYATSNNLIYNCMFYLVNFAQS